MMLMTGGAEAIVRELKFRGMRIVAVRAADAFSVHFALYERAKDIDFVFDLTITIVRFRRKQFVHVVIVIVATAVVLFFEQTTA